jgi:hypothetical protein
VSLQAEASSDAPNTVQIADFMIVPSRSLPLCHVQSGFQSVIWQRRCPANMRPISCCYGDTYTLSGVSVVGLEVYQNEAV